MVMIGQWGNCLFQHGNDDIFATYTRCTNLFEVKIVVLHTTIPYWQGTGGKKIIFQIAPTPYLSILICSNRYHNDALKVLLKRLPQSTGWLCQT